jgi:UDP-3-O-[3-hydroxymyristoyl] glucosamine N-acyltransferase
MGLTVGCLAALVHGTVHGTGHAAEHGDADLQLTDLADLHSAGPTELSFLTNPRYLDALRQTRAGAVLTAAPLECAPCTQIVCANPYLAMAQAAVALHPPETPPPGVAAGAMVSPTATVHATACIGPGAVVQDGAQVGAHSIVEALAFVGRHSVLGEGCHLHPGAKVLARCRLGNRVILHSGAVIGSDGFGYATDAQGHRHKIPQVGTVELGDDVELGANSTVDRATFGVTRIGARCKIDNLVQIAHNVQLGTDCVVVSQSGIAGSTHLGDRVVMGAQAGMAGHLQVASDTTFGGRTGVLATIASKGVYSGFPAVPHRQWLKAAAVQKNLVDLLARLRRLEAHVSAPTSP